MDERDGVASIPFFAHEAEMARMERAHKRLWALCLIIFLALVGTNAGWIIYEAQYIDEVTTETYNADAEDGGVAISNGNGEVNYNGTGEVY